MDDAVVEIKALRARLAELERMAEAVTTKEKGPMYSNDPNATDQAAIQRRLRAESWTPDADMERVVQWLEKDPDDARVSPGLRMSVAMYRESKSAYLAERPPRLDTTKGDPR